MEIQISKLSGALKKIAKEIDEQGVWNDKIDGAEVSVFKATFAFMVRHFRASDFEYTSIFGESAFTEWKQTESSDSVRNNKVEYTDRNGNIIRGSFIDSGVSVYTRTSDGKHGYYDSSMIMLPDED